MPRTEEGFEKDYVCTFKDEIFIVADIVRRGQIPMYCLIDYDHEAIKGPFYPKEL